MAKSHSSQIPSNGLCHVPQQNPITGDVSFGNLVQDKVSVENGFGQPLLTVDGFLFSCSKEVLVKGLVNGVKGVLGFGRSNLAFQSQMVNSFGFERKFLVCLSSKSNGFISSGVGMISNSLSLPSPLSLSYTPLEKSQKTHDVVDGYYVNVNSIKVNGRRLAVDQPIGAVEISSTAPYTVLKSTVYETLKKAFSKSMTMVAPVGPFGICFRSRVDVPVIELVMQSEMVKWRIHGRNLVVDVGDGVMCLGIVDGGLGMNGTMILGGYQLEDHVLEFNLGTSMMGFSSSLLMEGNSCSNIRETVSKSIQSL
ncbi:hypothetical protein QVD17_12552 [Tagetes erecta]|uniref:Peptidase A1 domain-containing protein n=1 Tax=Tagetes erecta TaxID=13708 RepID=A0AAD8L2B7_TARER|nr:hypothetical protein QVD17_12552 [Tagetes erecta]